MALFLPSLTRNRFIPVSEWTEEDMQINLTKRATSSAFPHAANGAPALTCSPLGQGHPIQRVTALNQFRSNAGSLPVAFTGYYSHSPDYRGSMGGSDLTGYVLLPRRVGRFSRFPKH